MRLAVLLQRRRAGRAAPTISLFPFLAVLICMMGSLVPLLLAMAHQARKCAAAEAASKTTRRQQELRIQREDLEWQTKQFAAARQKTETQLHESRQLLGHVEDHMRRLQQQAHTLTGQWKELEQSDGGKRQLDALSAEWQGVQRQLQDAAGQLETARHGAAKSPSYAIIPYAGPNQTRRRPIYLECTATAVILQPEGIELLDADFQGPLGANNPLVALLRATREHWIANGGFDSKEGDAYPLLLVRPDGISAYGAALAALKPWGSDYGYELIGSDWKLAFPPADPRLARVAETALDHARINQARVIAAAPRQYGSAPRRSNGYGYGNAEGSDQGYSPGGAAPRGAGPGSYPATAGGLGNGVSGTGRAGVPGTGPTMGNATPGYGVAGSPGFGEGTAGVAGGQNSGLYPATAGGSGTGALGTSRAGVPGSGPTVGNAMPGYGVAGSPGFGEGTAGIAGGQNEGLYPATAGGSGTGALGTSRAGVPGSGPTMGNATPGYGVAGSPGFGEGTAGIAGGQNEGPYLTADYAPGSSPSAGNNPALRAGPQGGGTNTGVSPSANAEGGTLAPVAPGGPYGAARGASGESGGSRPYASAATGQTGAPPGAGSGQQLDDVIIGRPGESRPAERRAGVAGADGGAPGVEGQAMRPGEWRDAPPKVDRRERDEKKDHQDRHKKNVAKQRDGEWGLPDAGRRATRVSRPIRVDCYANRLVVAPMSVNRVVPLSRYAADSTDELIAGIWAEIDAWGIAGKDVYWRPVLHVRVDAGAEQRFEELQQMLRGSGISVERG